MFIARLLNEDEQDKVLAVIKEGADEELGYEFLDSNTKFNFDDLSAMQAATLRNKNVSTFFSSDDGYFSEQFRAFVNEPAACGKCGDGRDTVVVFEIPDDVYEEYFEKGQIIESKGLYDSDSGASVSYDEVIISEELFKALASREFGDKLFVSHIEDVISDVYMDSN